MTSASAITSIDQLTSDWFSAALGRDVELVPDSRKAVAEGHTQCFTALARVTDKASGKVDAFFVKTHATRSEAGDEQMTTFHRQSMRNECAFYALEHGEAPMLPACVRSDGESGVLVLQDLNAAGCSPLHMQEPPLSRAQLTGLVDTFAAFHALHLGERALDGVLTQEQLIAHRQLRWEVMAKEQSAVERISGLCETNKSLISEKTAEALCTAAKDGYALAAKRIFDDSTLFVLQQGDANPNNFFAKANNEFVLVDFQEAACAHPLFDLTWLFVTSVSPELRRECQDELLRCYLTKLGAKDVDEAKFLAQYRQALRLHGLFILEIVGNVPIDTNTWVGRLLMCCIAAFED